VCPPAPYHDGDTTVLDHPVFGRRFQAPQLELVVGGWTIDLMLGSTTAGQPRRDCPLADATSRFERAVTDLHRTDAEGWRRYVSDHEPDAPITYRDDEPLPGGVAIEGEPAARAQIRATAASLLVRDRLGRFTALEDAEALSPFYDALAAGLLLSDPASQVDVGQIRFLEQDEAEVWIAIELSAPGLQNRVVDRARAVREGDAWVFATSTLERLALRSTSLERLSEQLGRLAPANP
jgi:hypothetical protein